MTLLARIEAAINSRPIAKASDDPDDINVLTPGHFMIGGPISALPEIALADEKETYLSRWQKVQRFSEHLWRRYSHEYLNMLQTRPKWQKIQREVKPGDIVLLRDPSNPPCRWSIAKIENVRYGSNNLPRVVDVRTAKGVYTRAVTQICPLVNNDD